MEIVLNGSKGAQTMRLVLPESLVLRWEIVGAGRGNALRVAGAAIAACWPDWARKQPKNAYKECDHDVEEFGGRFADWCLAAGVQPKELIRAGTQVYNWINESLPSSTEVEEAAKNSVGEGPETPSPSTSPS